MASKKRSSSPRADQPRVRLVFRDRYFDLPPPDRADPSSDVSENRAVDNDPQLTPNDESAQGEPSKHDHADEASASNTNADACTALSEKVHAQVAELQETFKAYIALERLISPDYEDEEQVDVPLSRAELGALLHTLNAAMQRQIAALAVTAALLQARMDELGDVDPGD